MSNKLAVIKDNPIGFWTLDNAENGVLKDFSGCNNNASYTGIFETSDKRLPLSPGGTNYLEINSSNKIDFEILNGYYQDDFPGGFGTINYGDNDFTIECWFYPKITTQSLTTVLGDNTNSIGLFYINGNIVFKLNQDYLEYTLPLINKSMHIVCVYLVSEAHIYVDGKLCASKMILSNPFINDTVLLSSGPTSNSNDKFLIDDVAVYRYGLPFIKIKDHYFNDDYTKPSQVSQSDNGEFFEFYETDISKVFTYSYPLNRPWEQLITDELYYDQTNKYIQIKKGDTTDNKVVVLEDTIYLPAATDMDSSKVEWFGDNGITVETSTDGQNYSLCTNGESIPQYTNSVFASSRVLNIKITITSENVSKYLPKLYSLDISFYNNQIMYSKNGSSYLSKIQDLDYYLGPDTYSILSRDPRNGILTPTNSGFNISLSELKQSVEFFYTPYSLNKSLLVSSIVSGLGAASEYSWNTNGSINKTNISSIYVNGVDVSAETLISEIFIPNNIHHVVINFTNPIAGAATINYKSTGSVKALYQYMSFYKNLLSYNQINNHYNLYASKQSYQTSGSYMALSENSVDLYNNDWLVIQNS